MKIAVAWIGDEAFSCCLNFVLCERLIDSSSVSWKNEITLCIFVLIHNLLHLIFGVAIKLRTCQRISHFLLYVNSVEMFSCYFLEMFCWHELLICFYERCLSLNKEMSTIFYASETESILISCVIFEFYTFSGVKELRLDW